MAPRHHYRVYFMIYAPVLVLVQRPLLFCIRIIAGITLERSEDLDIEQDGGLADGIARAAGARWWLFVLCVACLFVFLGHPGGGLGDIWCIPEECGPVTLCAVLDVREAAKVDDWRSPAKTPAAFSRGQG